MALYLYGRKTGILDTVAERCRAKWDEVHTCVLDLREGEALEAWLRGLGALSGKRHGRTPVGRWDVGP